MFGRNARGLAFAQAGITHPARLSGDGGERRCARLSSFSARAVSALPRMTTSGVRSSCDASAMKSVSVCRAPIHDRLGLGPRG
jgi:hypothetical protein